MSEEHDVRGKHGPLPYRDLEYHGFSINSIKEWREKEGKAGRPSSLEDFYAVYGLCFNCQSHGVQMIGWSEPSQAETITANTFGVDKLPVYEVCSICLGSGKADRSKWQNLANQGNERGTKR